MISGLRVGCLRMSCLRLLPYTAAPPPFCLYRCRSHRTKHFTTSCSAERQKVVVISGPTGAGKSRLSLELAKRLNGEIISADSVQVYKGLDIGSAKPSSAERQEVPHHLVDILHPSDDYSVGQFYEDARQLTREILSRGRVPIVTGGTGLYLRWFIYGKPDVPKSSPEITLEVNSELGNLQRDGDWDAAIDLVIKAGDPGVQSLATNDWYRLRRRLEILKSSGASPSAFQVPYNSFKENFETSELDDSSGIIASAAELQESNSTKDLDYDFNCFFLSTQRLDLYRALDFRCEDMCLGN
ncbi:hypothetical protein RD792_006716 [Penstemon davidsonii]|uniref:tRNA dimethylallyltransferase n=1 Tax=Penstemon davidsonii TaxID=160366 RepID=A0ABR0DCY0_9LAMI|nr:hypothetical protein RD792_006716 [Penstemon davidsonii]